MPFTEFKLIQPMVDALRHAGYVNTTPVQAAVIPPALRGKDVIGQAQTGTGKTCAFLVPFMNRWRPHKLKGPIGLVMLPTRELVHAGGDSRPSSWPRASRFRTVAIYGGTGYAEADSTG